MPHFKALAEGDEERLALRIGFCIFAPGSLIENNEGLFIKLEVHLLGHYISAQEYIWI